ncbi:MFS transporter [Mongoliimonas terrestris]|uniref:MFS transporter n=1 Tax=Mongoliimonas terrestris TaxID=1709001 RepID=UPI0009499671|nr:MFS transporter [Mongoliimonas terrestris]
MHPSTALLPLVAIILATVLGAAVQGGALGPLMVVALDERGVQATMAGVVVAAPFVTIALVATLVARLPSRYGPGMTLAIASLVGAASFLLYLVSPSPIAWLLVSALMGASMAVRWVIGEAWLLAATPGHLRGRVIGLQETLIGFATSTGPMILLLTGTSGAAPFVVCAAILVAVSPVALIAGVLDRRSGSGGVDTVGARMPVVDPTGSTLRTAVLLAAVGGGVDHGAFAFIPAAFTEAELLGVAPLLAASFYSLGGTLFQIPLGMLIDRRGGVHGLASVGAMGVVVTGLAVAVDPGPALTLGLLFVSGVLSGTFYTVATISVAANPPPGGVARGIAAIAVGATVGSAIGPVMIGALMDLLGGRVGLGVAIAGSGAAILAGQAVLARIRPAGAVS